MPTGRTARDAEALGIDVEFRRAESNETDRAIHVLQNFRNGEFRLTSVHHGEDGIAALNQGLHRRKGHLGVHQSMSRDPSAADDPDHSRAIWILRWRED